MTAAQIALVAALAATAPVSILWSLLIGTVLPGLTSVIAHEHASAAIKALLTALLAGVTGALTGFLNTPPHGWGQWELVLLNIAVAWITAVFAYLGAWKPSGAAAAVSRKTARIGIGQP